MLWYCISKVPLKETSTYCLESPQPSITLGIIQVESPYLERLLGCGICNCSRSIRRPSRERCHCGTECVSCLEMVVIKFDTGRPEGKIQVMSQIKCICLIQRHCFDLGRTKRFCEREIWYNHRITKRFAYLCMTLAHADWQALADMGWRGKRINRRTWFLRIHIDRLWPPWSYLQALKYQQRRRKDWKRTTHFLDPTFSWWRRLYRQPLEEQRTQSRRWRQGSHIWRGLGLLD